MLGSTVQPSEGVRAAPCCPYLHITESHRTTRRGKAALSRGKGENEGVEAGRVWGVRRVEEMAHKAAFQESHRTCLSRALEPHFQRSGWTPCALSPLSAEFTNDGGENM